MHIHAYMHTCICIYIYAYICGYAYMYIYVCVCVWTNISRCTYMHIVTETCRLQAFDRFGRRTDAVDFHPA